MNARLSDQYLAGLGKLGGAMSSIIEEMNLANNLKKANVSSPTTHVRQGHTLLNLYLDLALRSAQNFLPPQRL